MSRNGAEHEVFLYCTEVRWLSRGQVMKRLYELKEEISYFLIERQSSFSKHFYNINFIHGLAHLTDIFSHLKEGNTLIQWKEVTIMDAYEKISAFVNKIPLWKRKFQSENLANFPTLEHEISKIILLCLDPYKHKFVNILMCLKIHLAIILILHIRKQKCGYAILFRRLKYN